MDATQLAQAIALLSPTDLAALMPRAGLDTTLGLRYLHAAPDRVEAELVATEALVQPYGLVHGGVYCAVVESVCSVGAALVVLPTGRHAVGAENSTRFRRACRPGTTLRVVATPGPVDGDRHTWRARVLDGEVVVAEGEVVVRALPPGVSLAGEAVGLKG